MKVGSLAFDQSQEDMAEYAELQVAHRFLLKRILIQNISPGSRIQMKMPILLTCTILNFKIYQLSSKESLVRRQIR
jgi:hypothetical protein